MEVMEEYDEAEGSDCEWCPFGECKLEDVVETAKWIEDDQPGDA